MKMKMLQEDFITRNLPEFRDIPYCTQCMEPVYDQTFHCGKNEIIMFQDLDKETQRNIVQEELRRYA
jgi:hypothetical protein